MLGTFRSRTMANTCYTQFCKICICLVSGRDDNIESKKFGKSKSCPKPPYGPLRIFSRATAWPPLLHCIVYGIHSITNQTTEEAVWIIQISSTFCKPLIRVPAYLMQIIYGYFILCLFIYEIKYWCAVILVDGLVVLLWMLNIDWIMSYFNLRIPMG